MPEIISDDPVIKIVSICGLGTQNSKLLLIDNFIDLYLLLGLIVKLSANFLAEAVVHPGEKDNFGFTKSPRKTKLFLDRTLKLLSNAVNRRIFIGEIIDFRGKQEPRKSRFFLKE